MSDEEKNLVHPYYNHNYARYDLEIDEIIAGLKRAGYSLDGSGGEPGTGNTPENNNNQNTGTDSSSKDPITGMDPAYRLEVLSTRSTRCNSTSFNTILYPVLYKNNEDITDTIPATNFKWQRISGNSEVAKLEDAEWNLRYAAGSKECYITKEDIKRNSMFVCKYVEFEDEDEAYVNAAYQAYIKNAKLNGGDK
jgi:hypothetical protein